MQAKCSHLDHRPSAGLLIAGVTRTPPQPERARCRTATRYGGAVDVERAADLYTQGWSLRQIGAELGISSTTVSEHLRRAGVTMRRGGPSAHPASTQLLVELRDQGLTWPEIAEQVDMTVSGAWSRYRRARPPKSPRLGRWQQVLADALDHNFAIGVRAAVAYHLGRTPTRTELTAARRAAHSLATLGRARVLHVPGGECRRSQLSGPRQAECDHERHPTPRAGGCSRRIQSGDQAPSGSARQSQHDQLPALYPAPHCGHPTAKNSSMNGQDPLKFEEIP